ALVALLATADDVVGDVEGVELDPLDVRALESCRGPQLEDAFQRRLRVDFRIVLLQDRATDAIEILLLPVDLEAPADGVHEALVALEGVGGACDSSQREEGRVGGGRGDAGIGEALPVGGVPGAGPRERVEGRPADGERMSVSRADSPSARATPAATA